MVEQKPLEDWFEDEITVSKEDYINDERERVKKVFRYESGKVIPISRDINVPKEMMSIFVGKAVANQVDKKDTDIVKIDDLNDALDTSRSNIRANLSNLRKKKYIENVEDGGNKLIYSKLPEILDYILEDE